MIEWDHLRVVLAVHRGGSMAAAAELLGVDRATVLRRLDSIESQLKSRLFDRRFDGCTLTGSGRNIIGTIEGVEQAMTALAHRVEGDDKAAEGVVRLAGPAFLLESIVGPAIPTLLAMHPKLELELRGDNDSLDLARGDADIALRLARPVNEALVSRKVGSVAVALFASRAYLERRGTPKDGNFAGHDLLLLDGPLGRLPAMGWLMAQMAEANVPLRAYDVATIVAAVRADAGIACLPAIAVDGVARVEPVSPGIIGRFDVFLSTHRDLRERARVRSTYDFLVRLFAQRATGLVGAGVAKKLGAAQGQLDGLTVSDD